MGSSKALLVFDGQPLLAHIVQALQPRFRDIVVVTAPDQPLPDLPARIVRDAVAHRGPASGLSYGLSAAREEICFVTACDSPFLILPLVSHLLAHAGDADIVVPEWDGRLQPLPAVYRKSVLPALDAQLARGELSLNALFTAARTRRLEGEEIRQLDPDGASFFNINTPDDYARAVERWRERRDRSAAERTYSLLTANLAKPVRVLHVSPEGTSNRADVAAAEEPLEIRINGDPFAVIMRTPGADPDLTAGFLHSERVVRSAAELTTMRRDPQARNVIDVRLAASDARDSRLAEVRRRVAMNSSCGMCGRVTIESLRVDAPEITADWTMSPEVIASLAGALRGGQAVFDETGGLHAAGLFDPDGNIEAIAEDIGRHNAVDKVIGRMLLSDRLPLARSTLFVSGRTSFEIVQKAFLAGIPVVGAVSAPSSLAVELADEAGITLLGFVRGTTFNVYSHARRIQSQ